MHAQTLDRDGRGSIWKSGRAWARLCDHDESVIEFNPEWHWRLEARAGVGLEIGGGDSSREVQLHLSLPVGSFYFTVDGLPRHIAHRVLPGRPYSYRRHDGQMIHTKITEAREVTISWHWGALWWSLWHSTMEWSSSTPWWRHGSFHPVDWLLGNRKYIRTPIREVAAIIPMPERSYPATVTFIDEAWRRPRWPFVYRRQSAQIDIPGGVPVPGKGENAYDCEDDAIMSMGATGHSLPNAIATVVKAATAKRVRYGGANWRPEEMPA